MTKKMQKITNEYRELMNIHLRCFQRKPDGYNFTYKFLHDTYEEFTTMIGGMFRFNVISEKDYEEAYRIGYETWNDIEFKLWTSYVETA